LSSTTPTDQRPADRRPIGFWLKLVDRLIDEGFDAVLGEAGLTHRHWQVAEPAADRAGDPPADRHPAGAVPSRRRGDDPSVPDDLEARGWVTWTEDQQATLTELGAAAHADLLEKVSQRRARLSAGISPQEYTATIEVLRRMAVNLGWAESS
jgi:hypothetical protein